jgi:hypothetical protein
MFPVKVNQWLTWLETAEEEESEEEADWKSSQKPYGAKNAIDTVFFVVVPVPIWYAYLTTATLHSAIKFLANAFFWGGALF